MKGTSRYHPLLVSLHWGLAILIIDALRCGFFGISAIPNSAPLKIDALRTHMAEGMLILALMLIRFFVRVRTSHPPNAMAGHPLLDRVAAIAHDGFYVLILLIAGTGLATAVLSGLNLIVFGGSGAPLPPILTIYPTRVVHGYVAQTLAGLLALHILAAAYHQFVRKDALLLRMTFGRRVSDPDIR